MGKYVNGTFVPDENDLLLQQQQKMAGLQSAPQPQQAVSQPAPVTQPNPEVAEFAKAKTNNQSNNSPRVAGQAGTVYNIFKQPAVEQAQRKAQPVFTPVQPSQTKQETQTTPVIRSTDELAKAMGYTSPEEEEKMRKASVANQRIMAVADALRQIGNIYNTVHYAPSQQFNSPVEMERQRYQQAKALRDRANQTYISYQQAKAAQDAKQRQWEAEQKQKADQWNANFKFNAAKAAADLAERQRQYDSNLAFNKDKWKEQADLNERKFKQQEAHQRASLGLGYARLNETKRHNNVMEGRGGTGSGGSRGGSRSQATIYSRRGYLTKAGATDADMKRVYDNLYEWGKKRGKRGNDGKVHPYIDEGGILAGINPDMFGGKKISDVSKREAVDRMIMEHDDAAVELAQKYGFQWHEQTPSNKKDPYSQYLVQPNSGGTSNSTDYSKYIRK